MENKKQKYIPKRLKKTETNPTNKYNSINKKKSKNRKSKKINRLIFLVLIIVFLGCATYFGYDVYERLKNKKNINNVQEYMNVEHTQDDKEKMEKVQQLQSENEDVVGWIEVKDTNINYPILQGEDNDYYLNHDYKNQENKYGSIYLKNVCDINNDNSNVVIYGHDMKDGEMFNNLLNYKDQEYYKNHDTVKIITKNEVREYKIFSAFISKVFRKNEKNVFRYYNEINFENEEKYNQFIENAKKIQLYDTGVSANYGEQLITMITCEYSQDNGRMVVVAKRVK